jgi:hypothetical protein
MSCGDGLLLATLLKEPAQVRLPTNSVERMACVALCKVTERRAVRYEIMKRVLDQEAVSHSPDVPLRQSHPAITSFIQGTVYVFTGLLIVLALGAGGGLLLNDLASHVVVGLPHAPVSAAPLLLIGAASLGFQALTHPRPLELFKALLVSLAFILWGIDQMLPPGWLTTTVGDVVIVLYVIDLGWIMGSALRRHPAWKERRKPPSR